MNIENDWRKEIRDYEARSLKAFENAGMKRIEFKDIQIVQNASEQVWMKLSNKLYPSYLLKKILKELKGLRSEKEKK